MTPALTAPRRNAGALEVGLRRDEGIGLIDVIIAVALSAILMGAITGVFHAGFTAAQTTSDSFKGDADVQQLIGYLTRDANGSSPQFLPSGTGTADVVTLGAVDVASGRFLHVTYTYAFASGEGTVTRLASGAGPATSVVVAHHLAATAGGFFQWCTAGAGCPTVTARIAYSISGQPVQRSVQAALRVQD
ncbi:MAG: hypothetical protein ABR525_06615 [Candidatus Limnocylindria bacterium]